MKKNFLALTLMIVMGAVIGMTLSAGKAWCGSDRDADGIWDPRDRCPDDPAPGTDDGCPVTESSPEIAHSDAFSSPAVYINNDPDEDGIKGDDDACPREYAETENGCPEVENKDDTTDVKKDENTELNDKELEEMRQMLMDSSACSFVPGTNPNFVSLVIIAISLVPLAIRRKLK